MEWIKIIDQLPPEYQVVLCVGRQGSRFIASRQPEDNVVGDKCLMKLLPNGSYRYCKHWMHLPEPPDKEV